nr:kinase [Cafeteriavirus-dependent mavirus]
MREYFDVPPYIEGYINFLKLRNIRECSDISFTNYFIIEGREYLVEKENKTSFLIKSYHKYKGYIKDSINYV